MHRFSRARPTGSPQEPLNTKASMARAYQVAYEPTKEKKAEQIYDRNAERISSVSEKSKALNDFYHKNQWVITGALINIASVDIDGRSIETAINGFAETAKVVMKGLDALSQIHPFIGVAVTAFTSVMSLDISRRENNKKIQVLFLDMQDLMAVLFRLRDVEDPEERAPDGRSLKGRLQNIMGEIADHVIRCGSACDVYMKKTFITKVFKAKFYEERLAGYAKLFEKDRARFMEGLTIHTARGVDEVKKKLDQGGEQLRSIEDKMDRMMNLFQKLESSREKDIRKFVKDSGGEEVCLHTDHLLIKLLEKGGEPLAAGDHPTTGKRVDDLGVARDRLSKELSEDIGEAIRKNLGLFEEKLRKRLQNSIDEAKNHIITAMASGAHDRILNPDLREIWRNMGWKGSVKARHFVFALHDYYAEKFAKASIAGDSSMSPLTDYPGTPLPLANSEMDDQWVLPYLDVPHVQAILEAIDDDGTGFITINEVNTFTESRPKTPHPYSLLQWIAYWAAGWHLSVSDYKNRIYVLVKRIFTLVENVLPANKHIADTSLFDTCFWGLERLLCSTQSVSGDVTSIHPELAKLVKQYNKDEESRLKDGLKIFRYELDTPATVALVTGPGRIGRYIYPLLFLLLRRYVKIMKVASKHVLHADEFTILTQSMKSILQAVDERIRVLVAVFKQTHLDVRNRLGNVAFGMFQLIFDGVERNPSTYSFFDWKDTSEEIIDDYIDVDKIPPGILKYEVEDIFEYDEYVKSQSLNDAWNSINGLWAGHCYAYDSDDIRHKGLLQITISLTTSGSGITGNGEGRTGLLSITGTIDETGADTTKVALMLSYKDGYTMRCNGIFDPKTDTIKGDWNPGRVVEFDDEGVDEDSVLRVVPAEGDDRSGNDTNLSATPMRTFEFTRTPSYFYKFRHKLGSQPTAKSRWLFACSAIRQQVRQRLWSWNHIQAHCRERRRFMDLITRRRIHRDGYTPFQPLSQSEVAELANMERNICPSDTRLYTLCVDFQIRKIPHHFWFFCDACERQIIHTRMICATCTSADLSDNIDLCLSCAHQTPSRDKFDHKISHVMVQTDRVLYDYNLAWIIREANVIVSRVKSNLRDLQDSQHKTATETHETFAHPTSEMLCECCGKAMTTPFWVCIECTSDTYICHDCNSKRKPPLGDNGHKVNHFLAQVYDSKKIVEVDAVDPRFQSMERRITELESKVQRRLEAMESNINSRLAAFDETLHKLTA